MSGKKGEKNPMFGKGSLIAGEKHGRAKLREGQVFEILAKRAEGLSLAKIAKEYGVSPYTVRDIIQGKRWKHVIC